MRTFQDYLSARWCGLLDSASRTPAGTPILIDMPDSVVDVDTLVRTERPLTKTREGIRLFLSKHTSRSYSLSDAAAKRLLQESPQGPLAVLVVGGGTLGPGVDLLANTAHVELISFDIYDSEHVDFIADAHDIPLRSESIDILWVQAVLEHVADPVRVATECKRVLKPGGLVYAETPFMQQVHGGRHDFTRFTGLGHRMLFPGFDTVSAGAIDGPGTALAWAIRYFVHALFRSKNAGRAAGLAFAWLKLFDRIMPERFQQMGASSFFFLGRKRAGTALTAPEMLTEYAGV